MQERANSARFEKIQRSDVSQRNSPRYTVHLLLINEGLRKVSAVCRGSQRVEKWDDQSVLVIS